VAVHRPVLGERAEDEQACGVHASSKTGVLKFDYLSRLSVGWPGARR
jgi:hypothetical protein